MSASLLYDWIISEKSVRGSRNNDMGQWQSSSAPPIAYDRNEYVVMTADKKKYCVFPQDICKAANVHIKSAQVLASLPPFN
jgi:hypothetical protein